MYQHAHVQIAQHVYMYICTYLRNYECSQQTLLPSTWIQSNRAAETVQHRMREVAQTLAR